MATFATNPAADPITGTEKIPLSQGGVDKQASPLDLMIQLVNAQSGTTYTYLTSDKAKLVSHANGASIAGTLPEADSPDFPSGWWMDVQNTGAGTLTITPTTSTIDGAATLVLATGQGVRIASDGSNYFTMRGMGGGSVAAADVSYDNSTSGLAATEVQAAIDEIAAAGASTALTIITEASAFTAVSATHAGTNRIIRAGGDVTFDSAETYVAGQVFSIRATAAIELIEDGVTLTPPAGGTLGLDAAMSVTVVMTSSTAGDVIGQTVAA
jgi:hypothetical protein